LNKSGHKPVFRQLPVHQLEKFCVIYDTHNVQNLLWSIVQGTNFYGGFYPMNDHLGRDETKSIAASEADQLQQDIFHHIRFNLGLDPDEMNRYACFMGLAFSVKDRLISQWINTQKSCRDALSKRVFYLSLEFLPGRFLKNYLVSLGMEDLAREMLLRLGFDLDALEEEEWDAGLGNGGLGRHIQP
jgi:hypothetical protein